MQSYQVSKRCASITEGVVRLLQARLFGILAGRSLGAARLHPHRLSRHLRGAHPLNDVLDGESAGRVRAKVGELSGEFGWPAAKFME
jgi:hypothetical protein